MQDPYEKWTKSSKTGHMKRKINFHKHQENWNDIIAELHVASPNVGDVFAQLQTI